MYLSNAEVLRVTTGSRFRNHAIQLRYLPFCFLTAVAARLRDALSPWTSRCSGVACLRLGRLLLLVELALCLCPDWVGSHQFRDFKIDRGFDGGETEVLAYSRHMHRSGRVNLLQVSFPSAPVPRWRDSPASPVGQYLASPWDLVLHLYTDRLSD